MPFVVWFNFLAGFAYVAVAVGLATRQTWAARLALMIAIATAGVFLAFGLFVLAGTPFESRTVGAMTLRTAVWAGIAWFACRRVGVRCAPETNRRRDGSDTQHPISGER